MRTLHVWLYPQGEEYGWAAAAQAVDYFAQGDTEYTACGAFLRGLRWAAWRRNGVVFSTLYAGNLMYRGPALLHADVLGILCVCQLPCVAGADQDWPPDWPYDSIIFLKAAPQRGG